MKAKETTPGEKSAMPIGQRLRGFGRSSLRPLGALVLLLLVVFFLWQAWLIHNQADVGARLQGARSAALAVLQQGFNARRESLRQALADPAVQMALAAQPMDTEAAARRIRTLMPGLKTISFDDPDIEAVLDADLDSFGYQHAALLAAAVGDGTASFAAMPKDNALALVLPVTREDGDVGGDQARPDGQSEDQGDGVQNGQGSGILAYALGMWPLKPVTEKFSEGQAGGGWLQLQLGSGEDATLLAATGRGASADTMIDTHAVSHTQGMTLASGAALAPVLVPDSEGLAVLLALACLIGAIVLFRPTTGVAVVRRLKTGRGGDAAASDTTLEQIMEQEDEAERSAEAGGAAVSERPAGTESGLGTRPGSEMPGSGADSEPGLEVDPGIFRAYDIRGVVGKTLNRSTARAIGHAIGSAARDRDLSEMVVGRDGRLSGPDMADALIDGLCASGVDVIDIGAVPTPVVYFAAFQLNVGSGVAVTGSHNPSDYNGFKIVLGGETLSEEKIQDLHARIVEGRLSHGEGTRRTLDVAPDYIERIVSDIQIERPMKVVVDAGNGIPGELAPAVLEGIGCEVVSLYCEVDGSFPNHHPDPSDPANLKDLILSVRKTEADLGVAFDGDGDRLGVVTREGEIIYPDRLLMLFAIDVLTRSPGATIIYDVKCTQHLQPLVLKHGGSPLMWRTGHSLIKAKMRETEAALAGEMSGHFFFSERWYGFDDGIYAAARLMEILAADPQGREPEKLFAELPKGVSTPELKISMPEGNHHAFVKRFKEKAQFEGARITTIDGVRADWPDGWGLVRASNTTPVLVLRFDADDEAALKRVKDAFRAQFKALAPEMRLPF